MSEETTLQITTEENSPKKITPLQAKFIIEYLKDLNGSQAALRAGYSETSCRDIACDLLKKPQVIKEINIQLECRANRTLITADKVLNELYLMTAVDPEEMLMPNGELKPMSEIPRDIRKTIASIEIEELYEMDYESGKPKRVNTGRLRKIKLWNKNQAAETLAKHLKLITERYEIGNLDGSNFNFPGITEVFVDSPEAFEELKRISALPPEEATVVPVEGAKDGNNIESTPQP